VFIYHFSSPKKRLLDKISPYYGVVTVSNRVALDWEKRIRIDKDAKMLLNRHILICAQLVFVRSKIFHNNCNVSETTVLRRPQSTQRNRRDAF
jgi:hypothetical protein